MGIVTGILLFVTCIVTGILQHFSHNHCGIICRHFHLICLTAAPRAWQKAEDCQQQPYGILCYMETRHNACINWLSSASISGYPENPLVIQYTYSMALGLRVLMDPLDTQNTNYPGQNNQRNRQILVLL